MHVTWGMGTKVLDSEAGDPDFIPSSLHQWAFLLIPQCLSHSTWKMTVTKFDFSFYLGMNDGQMRHPFWHHQSTVKLWRTNSGGEGRPTCLRPMTTWKWCSDLNTSSEKDVGLGDNELELFFFFLFFYLISFWLRCVFVAAWTFSSCGEQGLLFIAMRGLSLRWLLLLRGTGSRAHAGSLVVAHRLSCSATCGIFLDQGSNPCPLHWQAGSFFFFFY